MEDFEIQWINNPTNLINITNHHKDLITIHVPILKSIQWLKFADIWDQELLKDHSFL